MNKYNVPLEHSLSQWSNGGDKQARPSVYWQSFSIYSASDFYLFYVSVFFRYNSTKSSFI